MKTPVRFPMILVGLGLICLILFWFWPEPLEQKSTPQILSKTDTVRLSYAKALITAPVLVALEKGYFSEEGLEIEITGEFSSGKESFDHMLQGKADLSTPATTPLVFNSFERQDYSIFVTYLTTYEGIKLISRNRDIVSSSQDLKGKRIGIVKSTISEILIDSLLAYDKILSSEIVRVGYKGNELPEMLKRGSVDAISVWEPYAYEALNKIPDKAVQIPTSKVYRIAINMASMNDFARQHPEVLVKAIRGLEKAVDLLNNHTEEGQQLLSAILNMQPALVSRFLEGIQFKIGLDQLLILTMENEARWAINHLTIENRKIPNYMDYIRYQPLESVNPTAVTLVRSSQ